MKVRVVTPHASGRGTCVHRIKANAPYYITANRGILSAICNQCGLDTKTQTWKTLRTGEEVGKFE